MSAWAVTARFCLEKEKKVRSKCMIGENEAGYWACSTLLCDRRERIENQRKVVLGTRMGGRKEGST